MDVLILLLKIIASIFIGFLLGGWAGLTVSAIFGLIVSVLIGVEGEKSFKVMKSIMRVGTGLGAILGIIYFVVGLAIYVF